MQSESPENRESFCILVQAMIGPKGESGEESFDFTVCTPAWLQRFLSENAFMFGMYLLLVERYDYNAILQAISSICKTTSGSSWAEVAEQVGRYGRWEFEDYNDPLVESQSQSC